MTANDFYCDNVFSGKVKVSIISETPELLAFKHTQPSYPYHVVIVPKQHIVIYLVWPILL